MKKTVGVARASAVALGVGVVAFCAGFATAPAPKPELYRALQSFGFVLDVTERKYVTPVDSPKLVHEGADAMLKTLDPYSGYSLEQKPAQAAFPPEAQRRGDVVVVRMASLTSETAGELAIAIDRAKAAGAPVKGVIVDLRDCDGGNVEYVQAVASLFLSGGTFALVHTRDGLKSLTASDHNLLPHIRVTVLVGPRTSWGGEMIAGALKELRGAKLVGGQTAGRDEVSTIYPLPSNLEGYLTLTTGHAALPSGASYGGKGLTPDIAATDDQVIGKAIVSLQ